jgi:3-hydroxyisobutyrate dehydrogenase-like beta-hydroxyacid dehydrogenase
MDRRGVGLLNPGSMGAAVAQQMVGAGSPVYWLPDGRGPATHRRAEEAGLTAVPDLAAMAESCWLIVSVCPPAAAGEVAGLVAAESFAGVYLEANAISPGRARTIAGLVAGAGAQVVDGGIVGPPPRRPGTTRLYLSGPEPATSEVAAVFAPTALAATVLAGPVGQASALKLAFASYNKISQVLAAQAAGLAAAHGVLGELLDLAAQTLPDTPLGRPDRLVSAAARAWRWGPEMREIADACAAAGLAPEMALAAAALLGRWDAHKDDPDVTLEQLLADLATPAFRPGPPR